jgi:GR25 family glycosyltransferase involved in LPS biosynthesis
MRRHCYADLADGRVVYWTKSTAWGTGGYTIKKDAGRALVKFTKTFWTAVHAGMNRMWVHGKNEQTFLHVASRSMDVPSVIGHRIENRERRIGFHKRLWRRGTRQSYRSIVVPQRLQSRSLTTKQGMDDCRHRRKSIISVP